MRTHSPRCSAYTSAMLSETRYAMNGDLHVAYRASREGPRDLVFVPALVHDREPFGVAVASGLGLESMTSLGRMIFFDLPGTR